MSTIIPDGIFQHDDITVTSKDPYVYTDYYPKLASIVKECRPESILVLGLRLGYSLSVILDAAPVCRKVIIIDCNNKDFRYKDIPRGTVRQLEKTFKSYRNRWPSILNMEFVIEDLLTKEKLDMPHIFDFVYIEQPLCGDEILHNLELIYPMLHGKSVIVINNVDSCDFREVIEMYTKEKEFKVKYVNDESNRGRAVLTPMDSNRENFRKKPEEIKSNALNFVVTPGIGDVSWLYSKFMHLSEITGRDVVFYAPAGERYNRSYYLLDLLPNVINGGIGSDQSPWSKGIPSNTTIDQLVYMAERSIVPIEVNTHLGLGRRLEEYIPELPTSLHYPLDIPQKYINEAEDIIADMPRPIVAAYVAGARETQEGIWSKWPCSEWSRFLNSVVENIGGSVLMIGAEYDRTKSENVLSKLNVPYKTIIGQHLGTALHGLSLCDVMVSYPSGIGIMANVLHVPGLMLLSQHDSLIKDAYADPKDLKNGSYKVWVHPEVNDALEWFVENFKYLKTKKYKKSVIKP